MSRRILLASASPRRRELLALLGLPFDVCAADVDETVDERAAPADIAAGLASLKAFAAMPQGAGPDAPSVLVIGADTIVVAPESRGGAILGKPTGADDARRMLRLLSGATHTVVTGVALAVASTDDAEAGALCITEHTAVTFRTLDDTMIDAYLATGEPFDKAGAYGIQERAAPFVERIDGDYFNVVGLPLQAVARMLEQMGVEWWRGPAALD